MSRYNLRIKVGTYTGDATSNRYVSGIGFKPDFVLVKGVAQGTVFRTKYMPRNKAAYMAVATAHQTSSIQEILADGFQVGTNATTNSNAVVYHYIAIKSSNTQDVFNIGRYNGNGVDDRSVTFSQLGISNKPDMLFVKGDTTASATYRVSSMSTDTSGFFAATAAADNIQNMDSSSAQLGTSTSANGNGIYYDFVSFKDIAGIIKVGTYTGNATDNREITGVGFMPDFVLTKDRTAANQARIKTVNSVGEVTMPISNSSDQATDNIQALTADGFQVGTTAAVNGNGITFDYLCIKSGNFSVPIVRQSI